MIRFLKVLGIAAAVIIVIGAGVAGYINWGSPPKYEVQPPDLNIEVTQERLAIGEKIVNNICRSCHLSKGTLSGKVLINHPESVRALRLWQSEIAS